MSPAERGAYERAVVAAVERAMNVGEPGFDYTLRGVEASGSYPETEISVRYWDPRYNRERDQRVRLWRELVDRRTGWPDPPGHAAVLIKTWALGG